MTHSCGRYPCGGHTGGCMFDDCPTYGHIKIFQPMHIPPLPPPRHLPVNMPIPAPGRFTIAVIDWEGNVGIKVDQEKSPFEEPHTPQLTQPQEPAAS